ncbi:MULTISPECIES: alpha/beta hydrolase [Eikenella]|uniref:Alpha/beta hydrolase n=1 Tax=Eikenella longinqua TaxID=1795827 RepID=A0A1A9S360_9NEIS|nr:MULTISPECIES: alpha/beta hydrolase [Eikenella]OAM31233.1 alpha/beta hydrolase [Eikenella longinqua]
MKRLLIPALILAALFGLASCANQAFYYPDHADYGSPAQSGLPYQNVYFHSADGTRLHGWFVPAQGVASPKQAATIVHFHGNAQNLSAHWQAVKWLPAQGYNVFLFDYRGYGQSAGKPGRQGLFEDSNAALDYIRTRPDVDAERLLVFGQSLGGTNAIAAVGAGNRAGVRAIAIESTFSSYAAIAHDKLPGAGLLLSNIHSASRHIAALSPIPLLLIHGTADQVIPARHSQTLFDLARPPKQLVLIPSGTHLGLQGLGGYEQTLLDFFARHSRSSPAE